MFSLAPVLLVSWKNPESDDFPPRKQICRVVLEVDKSKWIHVVAGCGSGYWVHLPVSLYKLCALYICVCVLEDE